MESAPERIASEIKNHGTIPAKSQITNGAPEFVECERKPSPNTAQIMKTKVSGCIKAQAKPK